MTKKNFLITRQQAQAQHMAGKIHNMGLTTLVCPLLEIRAVDHYSLNKQIQALKYLQDFDIAIFTSVAAVTASMPILQARFNSQVQFNSMAQPERSANQVNWEHPLRWAAIGAATAAALQQYGISSDQIIVPQGKPSSSETLLARLIDFNFARGSAIIFKGKDGSALLAAGLRARAVKVECVTCYERCLPNVAKITLPKLLKEHSIDWIIVTCETILHNLLAAVDSVSEEVVNAVSELEAVCDRKAPAWVETSAPSLHSKLLASGLIVASARICATAKRLGWRNIIVAGGASDEEIIDAIPKAFQVATRHRRRQAAEHTTKLF